MKNCGRSSAVECLVANEKVVGSNPIARSKFDLSAETTCGTTINYFTTTLGFEADPSAACGGCSEGGRLRMRSKATREKDSHRPLLDFLNGNGIYYFYPKLKTNYADFRHT